MAEKSNGFQYQEPYSLTRDTTTKFRQLSKDYVSVIEVEGQEVLKVDPAGIELLAKEAMLQAE